MNTPSLERSLRTRLVLGLMLIALLSTASFGVLRVVLTAQEADAPTVNVSGRQRMLSQRVSLMALRYATATQPATRERARGHLEQAIDEMSLAHAALLYGDDARQISPRQSPAVRALFHSPTHLDTRVRAYLGDAHALLAVPEADLSADHPLLVNMLARSEAPLLEDLHTAVMAYEQEGTDRVNWLERAQLLILLATLLLLAAEGAFLFRPMVQRIIALVSSLQEQQRVTESRERELRIVLDSMVEGLIPVDDQGGVRSGYSQRVVDWFGAPDLGVPFWDVLLPHDDRARAQLELGFGQLMEGRLPDALLLDQMPGRFTRDDEHYTLAFQRIASESGGTLVTVSNVTATVEAERARAEALEVQEILMKTLKGRDSYDAFVEDTDRLLRRAAQADDATTALRVLHTLKGNMSIFGFRTLSNQIHSIEDALQSEPEQPLEPLLTTIRERWQADLDRVADYVGDQNEGVWLTSSELNEHLRSIIQGTPSDKLLQAIRRWRLEPAIRRLKSLAAGAERIAARLGKDIHVDTEGNYLRLPSKRFNPLWSELIHVIRNAVEHGIEMPEAREAAGKDPTGHLHIGMRIDGYNLVLEVSDDGAGVDFDTLTSRARERGVPFDEAEPSSILFADGITGRDEVSELSGRGVGLAAVQAAVHAMDGWIVVRSSRGVGTTFVVHLPLAAIPELGLTHQAA